MSIGLAKIVQNELFKDKKIKVKKKVKKIQVKY